jgi:hypothetical protein
MICRIINLEFRLAQYLMSRYMSNTKTDIDIGNRNVNLGHRKAKSRAYMKSKPMTGRIADQLAHDYMGHNAKTTLYK